ncbi:hypothetical protein B0H12DRAFT_278917 [Mycena haematopus]|nr:hypothetical protein B0H12DRAFT_278917 [Mycena haematopus]
MAHSDSKERSPLPPPVQMAGPPPYAAAPTNTNAPSAPSTEWSVRPRNYIQISKTFGALARTRFILDPNLHVPDSLRGETSLSYLLSSCPKPNLELAVAFGEIDADIKVLASTAKCADNRYRYESFACPRQTGLEASTTSGAVTLHINATHFSLRASSFFGRIRIFLPRTYHGPLTITSSLGAPMLSSELRCVCTPISEVGSRRRLFVGDLGVWQQRHEHGDSAQVGSSFGRVWVGYVGEEEEAKRAMRWDALQCAVNLVLGLVVFWIVRWAGKGLLLLLAFIGLL